MEKRLRLITPSVGALSNIGNHGVRALVEQLGIEALNVPLNSIYRFFPGFNAPNGNALYFRNGILQDTTGGDYVETDDRTITTAIAMLNLDRLLAMSIGQNIGFGGLIVVDRPPAGVAPGPYTTSVNYGIGPQLFVFRNGLLQSEGALLDYVITAPNQFTFNAVIPGVVIAVAIQSGGQGLQSRQALNNQGPFPGPAVLPANVDYENNAVLVFINGQLQSMNFDYTINPPNTINVTRIIPGAINRVDVIEIVKSQHLLWRN